MSDDPLDYPRLVRRALVGVVRDALRIVSNEGLPGEHHFFLAFRTDAPGVSVPAHLRQQYPEEMTIVLQHMFWDLAIDDERFSVTLRFGGAPEHVEVPFDALTAFADPSAHFGLRFDGGETAPEEGAATSADTTEPPAAAPGPRGLARPAAQPARADPPRRRSAPGARAPRKAAPASQGPTPVAAPAAKVVDLASFRKSADGDKADKDEDN